MCRTDDYPPYPVIITATVTGADAEGYARRMRQAILDAVPDCVKCEALDSVWPGLHGPAEPGCLAPEWGLMVAFPPCTHQDHHEPTPPNVNVRVV